MCIRDRIWTCFSEMEKRRSAPFGADRRFLLFFADGSGGESVSYTHLDGAVAGGEGMIHVIKKDLLEMKSSDFAAVCPVGAIKKAGLVKPPIPTDPVPVGSFGAAAAGGGRRRRRG